MIINNQKYSCEACIRGHRVTTCKHHDRPLTKINRKGRPFSTCTVCHRTPCPAPDEHGRLRRERDDIHRKPNRYTRPFSGFLPIAPRPRPITAETQTMRTETETETKAGRHTQAEREETIRSARQIQPDTGTQTREESQSQTQLQTDILDFPFDIEFDLPLDTTGIDTAIDTQTDRHWPYPDKNYGWEDISVSTPVPVPVPVPVSAPISMQSMQSMQSIQSMQSMQSIQTTPVSMPMQSMPWESMKGVGVGVGMGMGMGMTPTNEEWTGLGF